MVKTSDTNFFGGTGKIMFNTGGGMDDMLDPRGGQRGLPVPNRNQTGFTGGYQMTPYYGAYGGPNLTSLGHDLYSPSPMDPRLTGNVFGWLGGQVGQGATPYGGPLSAGTNDYLQQILSELSGKGGGKYTPGFDDLLSVMKGGGPGGDILGEMARTGMPTDQGPAWEAMMAANQRNIQRGAADIKEQMNFAGNLVGTPFGNTIGDYYNQATKDENALLAQMTTQAQESARGRQMSAADALQGRSADIGSQLASMGMNASQFMQALSQDRVDKQYQEWLRTRPEYNPLLSMMYGGATTFPPVVSKGGSIGIGSAMIQNAGELFKVGQGIWDMIPHGGGSSGGGGGFEF